MSDNYGYIYCMSNKCMNGIVKIGITNNNPLIRAKQLFNGNTSIPCEFEVKFSKKVKNPKEEEKNIHNMLRDKRYPRREFFEVSEEEVRQIFSQIQGEWWDEKYDDNQNEYIELEDTSSEDAYDEPNEEPNEEHEDDEEEEDEDEEGEDIVLTLLKQQQTLFTEQKLSNIKKHFDLINCEVERCKAEKDALYEQMRTLDDKVAKLKRDSHDKAIEENKAVQQKLDKVKATIAVHLGQNIVKTSQRKSSGEVVKAKSSTFFSRRPLNEMVNQNTRFIYEQKKGCIFKRFCLIHKARNCVYECDEHGTIKGQAYRSLNDFCVAVKKSVKYQGSLKQDTSVVLKYYDVSSHEYRSFKDLTSPLN